MARKSDTTPIPNTAGYSGTPLAKKIGIKPGARVRLVDEPDGFLELLEPIPDDVEFVERGERTVDVTIAFCRRTADAVAHIARLGPTIVDREMLWIGWPKRTSSLASDLSEDIIRQVGLDAGLVDVKVCAIDATWSGLKFVRRKADRPR